MFLLKKIKIMNFENKKTKCYYFKIKDKNMNFKKLGRPKLYLSLI